MCIIILIELIGTIGVILCAKKPADFADTDFFQIPTDLLRKKLAKP